MSDRACEAIGFIAGVGVVAYAYWRIFKWWHR